MKFPAPTRNQPAYIVELHYHQHTEIVPNVQRVNACKYGLLLLRDSEPALVRDVPDRIVVIEQESK